MIVIARRVLRAHRHRLVAAAIALAPRAAGACSVCTGGQSDEVRRAMLTGSLVLSVLPLLATGGVVWWLRRRARALATGGPTGSAVPSA